MRLDTARRFALSLPEVTEEPHFEKSSFRVRGKIFATVPEGGQLLHLSVDPDEGRALIEGQPDAFSLIVWGKQQKTDWIRVTLAKVDRAQLCELLEDAWLRKAPKTLVAAHDQRRSSG